MMDLDPADLDEYRAFLDKRGYSPMHFEVSSSPAGPAEGELGPSSRTVTVSRSPGGAARTYPFRTWVEDFKADVSARVFDS
jgi:hypothetical protein